MRKIEFLALASAIAMLLCACGGSTEEAQDNRTLTSEVSSETTGQTQESQPAEAAVSEFAAEAEKMIGEWTGIYAESVYCEEGEENRYFYYYGVPNGEIQEYYDDLRIMIYKEDGELRLDLLGDLDFGMELIPTAGAAYDTCKNSTWKADVKFGHTERTAEATATLINDNVLEYVVRYTFEDTDGYSLYTTTYFRDGSEEYNHAEDYQYPNKVTVSNAYDLIQAMGNDTKITLMAGEYDLTDFGYYSGLHNLCIEAEEGAKVEIFTREPSDPVLELESCEAIVIRGITAGHQVERGYCNGSVLALDFCSNITVEDCHLYGCGTFGISANNSYTARVINTEIYECSEGLINLYSCGGWVFEQCEMRDTEASFPINAYDSWSVEFKDCDFHDVEIGAECYFVGTSADVVSFENCHFRGVDQGMLGDTEIYVDNCTFE